jgi:hypothetical protein
MKQPLMVLRNASMQGTWQHESLRIASPPSVTLRELFAWSPLFLSVCRKHVITWNSQQEGTFTTFGEHYQEK